MKASELRKRLLQHYNNRCFFCGSAKELQFAHMRPTKLQGMGRGSMHRVYDIKNNLLNYELLCRECHESFDNNKEFKFSNQVYGVLFQPK